MRIVGWNCGLKSWVQNGPEEIANVARIQHMKAATNARVRPQVIGFSFDFWTHILICSSQLLP
ncbi:MAG: hypothetical protein DMG96_34315 [Acidobacteria bacterium]|nr:MAG: hypothetical protein DMG96_34315 [Acidobacteriota bacterium]